MVQRAARLYAFSAISRRVWIHQRVKLIYPASSRRHGGKIFGVAQNVGTAEDAIGERYAR